MIKLSGLHLLLTYQCNFECDHCFVWGSPWQSGVMTLPQIRNILEQAKSLGSVKSIYFEGGEPFLYYATLLQAAREAHQAGFEVGIVSNSYWALSPDDARVNLEPFAGMLADLSVSSDVYHYDERLSQQAQNAANAAAELDIPVGYISVAQPEAAAEVSRGQLPVGESSVMYRGRAAVKLADQAVKRDWSSFIECPHEDFRNPGRVHVDPFGNLHICQGICIGNLFHEPLANICENFSPEKDPLINIIMSQGPAGLVSEYQLVHSDGYADACHLCYEMRKLLRQQFPDILIPTNMYAVEQG